MGQLATATTRRVATTAAIALLLVGMATVQAPPAAADSPYTATAVAAGVSHTCALLSSGALKCWGSNNYGQLGLGDFNPRGFFAGDMGDALPAVDLGSGRTATAVTAGFDHTCAILDDGSVRCWGRNNYGQLGRGDTVTRGGHPGEMGEALPPVQLGAGRTAIAIAASAGHTCALLDNHRIKCWGTGGSGVLGLGDSTTRGDGPGEMGDALPFVDLGAGRTATAVATGPNHTCAVLDHGDVKCWGYNVFGELGLGDGYSRGLNPGEMGDNLPTVPLGTGRTADALAVGAYHTCAILDTDQVKCWGNNLYAQLGLEGDNRGRHPGEMGDALPIVPLGADRSVKTISSTALHTCAQLDNDQLKCWGWNDEGALGLGDSIPRGNQPNQMGDNLPTIPLGTDRTARSVSAGNDHTCAVLENGRLKCWGYWGDIGLELDEGDSRGDDPGEMGDNLPAVDLGTIRSYQIDGEVKRSADSAYTGAGTYNATGAGQTVASTVVRGGNATFDVRLTNRSTGTDSITVQGDGSVANFPVTYRAGDTDVTSAVVAGTYQLPNVAPGAGVAVTIQLGAETGAAAGNSRTVHLRGTSTNDATKSDTVAATVTAVDPPPVYGVDGQVRRTGDPTFVGADTYNTTGLGQKVKTDVRRRQTATFDVRFTNRSTVADGITVHGAATSAGFKVRYFVGATEVTTQVVAGTYMFANVAAGASADLQVKVKVQAGVPLNATRAVLVTGTSTHDASKVDAVKAKVRALP